MWMLALQVVIGVYLQVSSCSPACPIYGSIAACTSQKLFWVPALPPDITHLYLEMNYIREINDTSLSGLDKLQELDIGRQLTPLVIRSNTFHRQRNLIRLVLGFNVGLKLQPKAFVGLSNLRDLDLDYCSLNESILTGSYLQPLLALETLNLFGNRIGRLQPALFFSNLTKLTELNLKLNNINEISEADLTGFQGKHFRLLNLDSVKLNGMHSENFNWERCGNPFRRMSFKTLVLSSNRFSADRLRTFLRVIEGTKIDNLIISGSMGKGFSHNNLPDPDHRTFEGLQNSSVRTLDLSKNRIFALQPRVFSPLKEAKIINVSQNQINQISRDAFEGLQDNLQILNLSHNLLGEIYSHTFANLSNLRVLDLSHNHIGTLGYGSFRGLAKLRMLDLSGNSLRKLGLPASLPSLQYLLLKDNKLQTRGSLVQFASNSIHIDLEDNRLTDLEDVYVILTQLKQLQNLFFGGNLIKWCILSGNVAKPQSNSLRVLDLHDGSLQTIWSQGRCLTIFDNLVELIALDLSFNFLQSIPDGVFNGLNSLQEINLSSNSLTHLQIDIFPQTLRTLDLSNNFLASPDPVTFHSLQFINLSMNRFHCDRNLYGFLTWLKQTNVTFLSPVEELKCEFPFKHYMVTLLDYSTRAWQRERAHVKKSSGEKKDHH